MEKEKDDLLFDSLVQELRRGTIILSVLSQLATPQYGYSLTVMLAEKGVDVDPSTLYPLLRRLEKQGLLVSKWDVENPKPRKYYQITEYGEGIYAKLSEQWFDIVDNLNNLIKGGVE